MGVISDDSAADRKQPVCPALSALIREQGLNLIIDEDLAVPEAANLFACLSGEQELPLPVWPANSADLATCDSYRGFGINE